MLLRPLSVILDDARLERREHPQSILSVPRTLLESDSLGFPLRNFHLRNWSLRYSNCSSHHCSVAERNPCLRETHDRDERARNNVQNTNWEKTFNVPAVQGFTPLEVVVYLKTLTLLRHCLIFQQFLDVRSPKSDDFLCYDGTPSDTSSVSFSEEIEDDSLSESDASDMGDVASPKVVESIPLSQLYSRSATAASSSWPQISGSSPSSSSTSPVPMTVPPLPSATGSLKEPNVRPPSGFTPILRHSREQNDNPSEDPRAFNEQQTDARASPNTLFPLSGAAYTQMAVDTRVIPPDAVSVVENEPNGATAAHTSNVAAPGDGVVPGAVRNGNAASSRRGGDSGEVTEIHDEANGWVIC
eukprot:GEMP01027634.1.p1 GENE.GEMP01027634.1~~GEMP01027634.1.p1  ORF type:complete len:357 (+),score=85.92 GEMP01027634.1:91-1161(+)